MSMTDFTIISRSLSTRRFSTVVTIITVGVAVALMLVLLSMRDAGRQAFERGSGNMHLLVSGDSSPLAAVLNGVFYANAPARPLTMAQYQKLADDPRVDFAVPTQIGDSYQGLPVVATTAEFFTKFQPEEGRAWSLARGKFFEKDFELVLGSKAAEITGLTIGASVSVTHGTGDSRNAGAPAHVHDEFQYKVVGVLDATGSSHDRVMFSTLGSSWALHALDRLEREGKVKHDHGHDHGHGHSHDHDHDHVNPVIEVTDADRLITGVYVRLATRPGASVSAALPQLASELRRQTGFTVAAPGDEIRRLFVIVSNIDQVFLGIAAVVMLSSGVGIMLALYNSMNERRRQVAVLRVLGCSQMRVFGLVITESAVIGLLGAVAGVVLAVVGGMIVAGVLKDRLGLVIQPVYTPSWTVMVVVGTVLLAAAAGLIPALVAYRTSVANNLKPVG
jgi:putative ABC transport system permease protein